ncbi:hypothetical protein [uncultured Tenacibaculum sp.]|uniref:hypothetical protein n=1 Tax=uncultured Tenacibaculum sp. TaxID=174713 RepID=UPI00261C1D28|nr:hypothetical protein [uncultured Tenacibaculum sp.]
MKKYNFRKLLLILPILGLFLFQNCTKEEEIIENEPELITLDTESIKEDLEKDGLAQRRTNLFFSSSDNIRGWSWDGKTASYVVLRRGKLYLYIRSFNGTSFGSHREVFLSSSDNLRSWHWDGKTASYHVIKGGKTYLYVRPFDGYKFGAHREIFFSSGDNVRGWYWSSSYSGTAKFCTYLIERGGKTYKQTRRFDGFKFLDTPKESFFSSSDNIRGWSTYELPTPLVVKSGFISFNSRESILSIDSLN